MTPVTPSPAAENEGEVRLRAERLLVQCGPCDAGLPMGCACPTDDPRPVIAALLDALDAAAERVRVVEGERDDLMALAVEDTHRRGEETSRAESAEAARDALVAKVEALAEEFGSNVDWSAGRNNYGDNEAWESAARQVRALLGGEGA